MSKQEAKNTKDVAKEAAAKAAAAAEKKAAEAKAKAEKAAAEKAAAEAKKKEDAEKRKAEAEAKKAADAAAKAEAKAKAEADKKAKADAAAAAKQAKLDAAAAAKAAKEAAKQPEQNGIRRPNPESTCGKLWGIFDTKSGELQQPVPIAMVMQVAQTQGINDATTRTQYARWKQFYGITGRVTAPAPAETAAK